MTDTHGARGDDRRSAWHPTGIAVVTLLLSPVPAGILHALNYSRLGVPARKRLALFSNLIAGVALLMFQAPGSFPRMGATLLLAAYFYKTQEQLFQAHRAQGGRKASFFLPVCLAIAAIVALVAILFAVDALRE